MNKREVLFEDKWLRVVKLDGWFVASEPTQSKDNKAVAVLPYRLDDEGDPMEFLSRLELNPAHMGDDPAAQLSIITGACETGDPLYHAKMELLEEGGYNIDEERFEFLGVVNPMKASSTRLYLYAVEIKDTDIQGVFEGDGSTNEAKESAEWVIAPLMLTAKDPYIQSIMMRLMTKNAIGAKNWEEVMNDAATAAREWETYLMEQGPSRTIN